MSQEILIELIDYNKKNPRKKFDQRALEELSRDISAHGLIHPILVRPNGERYELVSGERRMRASELAGFTSIRAEIRELTDREAFEISISENINRKDIHPLEEADAFLLMMEEYGYDVKELSIRFGKSEGYVYNRIAVSNLINEARTIFLRDGMTFGIACELSKIHPANQKKALIFLCGTKDFEDAQAFQTLREFRRWISNNISVELSKAPFDLSDVSIIPEVGSCMSCQFRSGFNKLLFEDIEQDDICYNGDCYQKKCQKTLETTEAKLKNKHGDNYAKVSTEYHCRDKELSKDLLLAFKYTRIPDNECKEPEPGVSPVPAVIVHGDEVGKSIFICKKDTCTCYPEKYEMEEGEEEILDQVVSEPTEEEKAEDLKRVIEQVDFVLSYKKLYDAIVGAPVPWDLQPETINLILYTLIVNADWDFQSFFKEKFVPEDLQDIDELHDLAEQYLNHLHTRKLNGIERWEILINICLENYRLTPRNVQRQITGNVRFNHLKAFAKMLNVNVEEIEAEVNVITSSIAALAKEGFDPEMIEEFFYETDPDEIEYDEMEIRRLGKFLQIEHEDLTAQKELIIDHFKI